MATVLELNNHFFEISDQLTVTFPPQISGTAEGYSVDMQIPMSPSVAEAFKVDAFLSERGQGDALDGWLDTSRGQRFACRVIPYTIEDNFLKFYVRYNTFPEAFTKRVCDIAAEAGQDQFFEYCMGAGDTLLFKRQYNNGRDTDQYCLPSMYATDFVNYVARLSGVQVEQFPLADFMITPNGLRVSPLVYSIYQYNQTYSDTPYISNVSIVRDTAGSTRRETFNFTTDFDGAIFFDIRGFTTLIVEHNGLRIYADNPQAAVVLNETCQRGDNFMIRFLDANRDPMLMTHLTLNVQRSGTIEAGVDYDLSHVIYTGIDDVFGSGQMITVGFLGCITQTYLDVLRDLAALSGYTLRWDGETLHWDRCEVGRVRQMNHYQIEGYQFGNDYVGKKNYIKFPNDHSELIKSYNMYNLEASKDLATVKAVHTTDDNGYLRWEQWTGGTFNQGSSYFISQENGARLKSWELTQDALPDLDRIITAKVRTTDDTTSGSYWHIDGRDWLIIKRTAGGDGIDEVEAILMN